jgi:hypothetical protein
MTMIRDFMPEQDALREELEDWLYPPPTSRSEPEKTSKRMSGFREYLRNSDSNFQGRSHFVPDLDYETQEGVRDVLRAVRSRAPLVFVSGRAGTGKSRLINYMKKMPSGEQQVVVAPTGVAALALGASTIHAFFKLPVGVIDAGSIEQEDVRFGAVVRRMTRLVIDEISMVRADILDGIDARLRAARESAMPFGGVQVVLVGDFLQLPPVVREEDRDLLERLGYDTPFAFSSRVMQRLPISVATLKKVWRQSDPDMIEALGAVREGRDTARALAWLNSKCARPHRSGVLPLMLTATRSSAEEYNRQGLDELRRSEQAEGVSTEVVLRARASGSFHLGDGSSLPAPRELRLVRGARVMSVRNDPSQGYVNGSLGVVVEAYDGNGCLEDAYVNVRFDGHSDPVCIRPAEWNRIRQDWNDRIQAIVENSTGTYSQIPLELGFAITIHKSQGLSLDDVRIDLGYGAFAPGQLYVALSRARSLEGLSFVRPIEEADVRVDEMLVCFLKWARSADNLSFDA